MKLTTSAENRIHFIMLLTGKSNMHPVGCTMSPYNEEECLAYFGLYENLKDET